MLPETGADGNDITATYGNVQELEHGVDEARGAVPGCLAHQDHLDDCARGDRVRNLDILDLLETGQVGRRLARQGRHHPQPGGGNAVQAVKSGQVLADVGDARRRHWRLARDLRHHHRLASAVDPAIEKRLDPGGQARVVCTSLLRPSGKRFAQPEEPFASHPGRHRTHPAFPVRQESDLVAKAVCTKSWRFREAAPRQ